MSATPSLASPSSTSVWKRFQNEGGAPVPFLVLDEEGTISELTPAARALLDYRPNTSLDPCFFAHVHGRNLPVVMHDLAHMVCRRKTRASWLLRIRTGTGRWRWFRAAARVVPDDESPAVLVRLRTV